MVAARSQEELEAAHCWEADDHVPGQPAFTAFRRAARYHQAQWREANGHPIGTQPIRPLNGKSSRPVGSRLPLDHAHDTGANFITTGARDAATARTAATEAHQTLDKQRLWADLLWSPALAFNLFGDLAADLALADRAVHTWWPDAPGRVREVRFAYSPGRFDPAYLNSLRAFDAAFVLDRDDGTRGIIAIDVSYREANKAETPKPRNAARYLEVGDRSGVFAPAGRDLVNRSDLAVLWLEHLLLLSMLQHVSGSWSWGHFVVVHPAGNTDVADLCTRYRTKLADQSSFSSLTLEDLLAAGALPKPTVKALRDRYVVA